MQPMNPPQPPAATGGSSSSRAMTALILGIVGLVCCGLAAPFAWHLGRAELKSIDAGQSSAEGRGLATAGQILGIVGTVLLGLALVWVIGFGGLAFRQAMMHH